MNAPLTAKQPGRKRTKSRQEVQAVTNGHCLRTYGDCYAGATPHTLTLPSGPIWIVPVMLTSPGYGPVGEVGVVAVDPRTLEILDATPKQEVRAAGTRLARDKRDDLHAAFRRARTN